MASLKVFVGTLVLVCMYIRVSRATFAYSSGNGYGPWAKWYDCSKKCGGGSQYRTRVCLNPYSHPCYDKDKETRNCNVYPCAVRIGFVRPSYKVGEGDGSVTIEIKRSGDTSATTVARITVEDRIATSADYGPFNGKVTFKPGQSSTSVKIPIVDDSLVEPSEFFNVKLSSSDRAVVSIQPDRTLVVIIDNDVNGNWGPWSPYTKCNKPCGKGSQSRSRKCNNPAPQGGGRQCQGSSSQKGDCYNKRYCPINGGWTPYGSYGPCSRTCGGGSHSRSRTCTNPRPQHGGSDCSGSKTESRQCNKDRPCPIDGGWTPYGSYGPCSRTCGGGSQSRSRTCTNPRPQHGGSDCSGSKIDSRQCNTNKPCPINANWSAWGPYGACSRSCNGGSKSRSRTCTNPAPQHGGRDCPGPSNQNRQCNTHRCPVQLGFAKRQYTVREGDGSVAIEIRRTGDTSGTTTARVTVVPGTAGPGSVDYGSPNPAIVTFRAGQKSATVRIPIRDDRVVEPTEEFNVKLSSNDPAVNKVNPDSTKVTILDNDAKIGFDKPGHQSVPESIGSFKVSISRSGTTGLSHSVSVRSVDGTAKSPADFVRINPTTVIFRPNDQGSKEVTVRIINDNIDEKTENFKLVLSTSDNRVVITRSLYTINIRDNDVDGKWGRWSAWTRCDKPCGRGSQSRSRKCNNPAPQGGGRQCQGPSSQKRHCYNKRYCPINGRYGGWSSWSGCTKRCGGGTCYRTRKCNKPVPQHGGRPCSGPTKQTKKCNVKCCRVNGRWYNWSRWSRCSITCKANAYSYGYQKRYRKCYTPAGACRGAKCYGRNYQMKKCVPYGACRRRHYYARKGKGSSSSRSGRRGYGSSKRSTSNIIPH